MTHKWKLVHIEERKDGLTVLASINCAIECSANPGLGFGLHVKKRLDMGLEPHLYCMPTDRMGELMLKHMYAITCSDLVMGQLGSGLGLDHLNSSACALFSQCCPTDTHPTANSSVMPNVKLSSLLNHLALDTISQLLYERARSILSHNSLANNQSDKWQKEALSGHHSKLLQSQWYRLLLHQMNTAKKKKIYKMHKQIMWSSDHKHEGITWKNMSSCMLIYTCTWDA